MNLVEAPLSESSLKRLIKQMKISPRELLRTKEAAFKKLNLKDESVSDAQLVKAMAKHPELVQRPIVVKGSKAVLARPTEKLEPFL